MARRVCLTIDVDGVPTQAMFTRQPTEEEIEDYRQMIRNVRAQMTPLTPEQIKRQEAAAERRRERRERIENQ